MRYNFYPTSKHYFPPERAADVHAKALGERVFEGLRLRSVEEGMETLRTACAQVSPWGVDVASGVESTPGIKDHHKLRPFLRAVKP